jgi:hypothetical protein
LHEQTALPYVPRRTLFLRDVLEPIRFEREGEAAAGDAQWVEACHERVANAMQIAMDRLVGDRNRERVR